MCRGHIHRAKCPDTSMTADYSNLKVQSKRLKADWLRVIKQGFLEIVGWLFVVEGLFYHFSRELSQMEDTNNPKNDAFEGTSSMGNEPYYILSLISPKIGKNLLTINRIIEDSFGSNTLIYFCLQTFIEIMLNNLMINVCHDAFY